MLIFSLLLPNILDHICCNYSGHINCLCAHKEGFRITTSLVVLVSLIVHVPMCVCVPWYTCMSASEVERSGQSITKACVMWEDCGNTLEHICCYITYLNTLAACYLKHLNTFAATKHT